MPDHLANSSPDELYEAHLSFIERTAQRACRRMPFSREEREDFVSYVHVKLMEDGYRRVVKFKGRRGAKITTYLTTVIRRLLQDRLDSKWGKWRPSQAARRHGEVGILLDQLLTREGYSEEEAIRLLQTNHHVELSWQELSAIAAEIPQRAGRDDEAAMRHLANQPERADRLIEVRRLRRRRAVVLALLEEALAELEPEDRLIMKLLGCHTVAAIARRLGRDQKRLYREIDRLKERLRRALEGRGVTASEIADLLESAE